MSAVSKNSGVRGSPALAIRTSTPGWRDPRLWIGVGIVVVSVILGARVLAAADDSVSVWAVTDDVAVGDTLTEGDLTARRVRFAAPGDVRRYLSAGETLPSDLRVLRAVGSGELLPRAALGVDRDTKTVEVPIAVEDEQVPSSVASGSVVSVYLITTAATGTAVDPKARPDRGPVLVDVAVLDAPPVEESFGTSGKRQVVLAVPTDEVDGFFAALSGAQSPTIVIVRSG